MAWRDVLLSLTFGLTRNLAEYLSLVTLIYLLVVFWRVFKISRFRIRERWPRSKQMLREALNSTRTVIILVIVYFTTRITLEKIFPSVFSLHKTIPFVLHPTGLGVALSILFALLVHDTYFYWTHRLMHHDALFRIVHLEHHKSQNPSPWAAYSFSPVEAVIQGLFAPLYFFVVPAPASAVLGFVITALALNTLGHCGIDLCPRALVTNRYFGWITGTTHHDIHHAKSRSNYGLYFRVWDLIMQTEEPSFSRVYEYVRSKDNDGNAYKLLSPNFYRKD
jgi:Delta7-sterol 5-desaturase